MMTGAQYRESLRDGRRVFFNGVKVADVTEHARFVPAIDRISAGYDRLAAGGAEDAANVLSFPRSAEELRSKMERIHEFEGTFLTTFESLLAMQTAGSRMAHAYPEYRDRIERYAEHCRANDLRCVLTVTDAKGHRDRSPAQQDDPDLYLRVVESRPDGVVINGAKLHITAAAVAHELVVIPTKNMKRGEEQWAIACAVPMNAEGVTILNAARMAVDPEEREYHPFSYGKGNPEGFVVFENVFVPNERVFLNGEVEHSATFAHSLGLWQRLGSATHMVRAADMLVGLARLAAEANGTQRIDHIRDKIADMIMYATIVRAGLEAAIASATITPEGFATPNELYTNVAKYYGGAELNRMIRHVHDIAGGSILTAPLPGDLANPETRPYIDKYMRTMDGVDGEYRTRLFHALRDVTASEWSGHWQAATILGGGGLFAQRVVATKHYDMDRAKAIAIEEIGLARPVEG
ncbi:MAG TPA: 4-hydroxyphenylacetate 3-hydroxylase N-terminal domain-containing protein [Acidimicrobiales bacterium]|nr:4-hydroxyphenylacetate 3-hydroxylase N-terminal domain-containing protein [Acidimicrobiales bacterium]